MAREARGAEAQLPLAPVSVTHETRATDRGAHVALQPDTASTTARELLAAYDELVDREIRPLDTELAGYAEDDRLERDSRLSEPFVAVKKEANRRSARAGLYARSAA